MNETGTIFREALGTLKARPLVILAVAGMQLPLLALSLVDPGTTPVFIFVSQIIASFVAFLGLYIAASAFFSGEEGGGTRSLIASSFDSLVADGRLVTIVALTIAAITFFAFFAANIIITLAIQFVGSSLQNLEGTSLIIANLVLIAVSNILPVFILALFAICPQILALGAAPQAGTIVEGSYRLIKPRYARALRLNIIPELIAWIVMTAITILFSLAKQFDTPYILIALAVMAIIQGTKAAFLAAAFNRFYRVIEEEEEAKRKAAKKVKSKGKSGQSSGKKR